MKFLNHLLAGAVVVAMGISATGCNENPTTSDGPANPSSIEVSSISTTSVSLRWSPVITANSYMVSWKGPGAADTGSQSVATPNVIYTVTGLTSPSQKYTFTVRSVNSTGSSSGISIDWAGADRYSSEPSSSTKIRIYEKSSVKGSAITIDPLQNGPRNVSVIAGTPGRAQLSLYVYNDSVIFGPTYAITEYKISAANDFTKLDSSIYISDDAFAITSLNDWHLTQSLDKYISADGNVSAFNFLPTRTGNLGVIVRTGIPGQYHYARVMIVAGSGGKILQGSGDKEYYELEISYQNTPNLPYAKPSGGDAPVAAHATKGH